MNHSFEQKSTKNSFPDKSINIFERKNKQSDSKINQQLNTTISQPQIKSSKIQHEKNQKEASMRQNKMSREESVEQRNFPHSIRNFMARIGARIFGGVSNTCQCFTKCFSRKKSYEERQIQEVKNQHNLNNVSLDQLNAQLKENPREENITELNLCESYDIYTRIFPKLNAVDKNRMVSEDQQKSTQILDINQSKHLIREQTSIKDQSLDLKRDSSNELEENQLKMIQLVHLTDLCSNESEENQLKMIQLVHLTDLCSLRKHEEEEICKIQQRPSVNGISLEPNTLHVCSKSEIQYPSIQDYVEPPKYFSHKIIKSRQEKSELNPKILYQQALDGGFLPSNYAKPILPQHYRQNLYNKTTNFQTKEKNSIQKSFTRFADQDYIQCSKKEDTKRQKQGQSSKDKTKSQKKCYKQKFTSKNGANKKQTKQKDNEKKKKFTEEIKILQKTCKCSKTNCLTNYCHCHKEGRFCTRSCDCICQNFDKKMHNKNNNTSNITELNMKHVRDCLSQTPDSQVSESISEEIRWEILNRNETTNTNRNKPNQNEKLDESYEQMENMNYQSGVTRAMTNRQNLNNVSTVKNQKRAELQQQQIQMQIIDSYMNLSQLGIN